jgi:hypothetical protein
VAVGVRRNWGEHQLRGLVLIAGITDTHHGGAAAVFGKRIRKSGDNGCERGRWFEGRKCESGECYLIKTAQLSS